MLQIQQFQDVPKKAYVDAQLSATDLTISTAGDRKTVRSITNINSSRYW